MIYGMVCQKKSFFHGVLLPGLEKADPPGKIVQKIEQVMGSKGGAEGCSKDEKEKSML